MDLEPYASWIDGLATRIYHSARGYRRVSQEDLRQVGYLGFIDAVHRFDPLRGISFSTFCYPRIRGAMLDELRGSLPLTRYSAGLGCSVLEYRLPDSLPAPQASPDREILLWQLRRDLARLPRRNRGRWRMSPPTIPETVRLIRQRWGVTSPIARPSHPQCPDRSDS